MPRRILQAAAVCLAIFAMAHASAQQKYDRTQANAPPPRPQAGAWPTYNGNPSGNRFSPLDQINPTTIHSLAPKWMFTIQGAPRTLQMTPVVVDGVMYVTSVNEAYALDARSGRAIWHYSRPRTQGLAGDAATGINRGVAMLGDRVFMATDNAHLIALQRDTGQLLWDVEMADARQNYGATGAPLAVNDLVIAGVSAATKASEDFSTPTARRPVNASGDSGRCPRLASLARRRGAAARSRRMRRDVADRHLRSRVEAALLAHGQSVSGLQR